MNKKNRLRFTEEHLGEWEQIEKQNVRRSRAGPGGTLAHSSHMCCQHSKMRGWRERVAGHADCLT